MMERLVTVTTRIPEDVLKMLKKKTGEKTNKEALAKAIYHYIICTEVKEVQNTREKKRKTGRSPFYLDKVMKEYKDDRKNSSER